jgi:hypothetical protein
VTDEPRSRADLLAELKAREVELAYFEAGKLTMLEDGSPVTPQMVRKWREEIAELRRLLEL